MAKVNKTRFVILGFLLNDSFSGYEIGRMIEQSTKNFWQESDASIYPTLRLLLKEGLVSSQTSYIGKRRKEIFTITETGKKAFMDWFQMPPDQDQHREEFLLKLFFTTESTEGQMQAHCGRRLKELKETLEKYKKIEDFLKQQLPEKTYWLQTLRIGIAHIELDIGLLQQHGELYAANHH